MTDREALLRKLDQMRAHFDADDDCECSYRGSVLDMLSIVRGVLERHRPGLIGGTAGMTFNGCIECRKPWPCADAQAVAEALE